MAVEKERTGTTLRQGRIWIDLDNSPHVPFFAPIIEELQTLGYSLLITARDCFQVRELADLFHLKYRLIGHHSGRNRFRKFAGLGRRALQLLPIVLRSRPHLAISHCSRSQLIVSSCLRIPSLQMGDYEFATPWVFFRPTWLMCPDVIPDRAVPGAPRQILKYPGIKEDVYVPRFVPNADIRRHLGLEETDVVATIRPPASEAHYHNSGSDELFEAVVESLSGTPGVKIVMLPRNNSQANQVKGRWPDLFSSGKMRIPAQAVDGLNLIWHSDFVVSAGGTMNREAAALGVPVYSIFRGKIGAVDRYLNEAGRLELIESAHAIQTRIRAARRNRPDKPESADGKALNSIVGQIVAIMDHKCCARA